MRIPWRSATSRSSSAACPTTPRPSRCVAAAQQLLCHPRPLPPLPPAGSWDMQANARCAAAACAAACAASSSCSAPLSTLQIGQHFSRFGDVMDIVVCKVGGPESLPAQWPDSNAQRVAKRAAHLLAPGPPCQQARMRAPALALARRRTLRRCCRWPAVPQRWRKTARTPTTRRRSTQQASGTAEPPCPRPPTRWSAGC
jgi:hypothetical protein